MADIGSAAGEDEQAAVESEIDTAAFFAGGDGGLADGGVKGANGEFGFDDVAAARENIAPFGEAAFDQTRVNGEMRAAD